ncbi:hypothetical protein ABMA27_009593 [Loxostege sticticalis]
MKKVVKEFQAYVYHFSGGTEESNQYLFDVPALLKTEAPIVDNPKEDPIEEPEVEGEEEEVVEDPNAEKPWWELIEGDCKPFVMFGDMAEFRPPQRREVLKTIKAAKTAPRKWKEYVFNEMFLRSDCSNADVIKDEYPHRAPEPGRWECQGVQTDRQFSKMSVMSRRVTTTSIDVRGNMGSILKIITSNITEPPNKPNILAARDSMEIASTTKLRDKHHERHSSHGGKVVISVGSRKTSMLIDQADLDDDSDDAGDVENPKKEKQDVADEAEDESLSLLGSIHNDSMQVIASHKPEKDHKIHYEKVCPMEKCQRMEVDSFIRSLPPYMRANPFTHFEQSYEDYETCTPEQLEILKQRIEIKKSKVEQQGKETCPLAEWGPDVEGVGVQTSEASLPPCTCRVPSPTPVSSTGRMFDVQDLIPIKQKLDEIRKDCFYAGGIEFDRFKVIGQESDYNIPEAPKEDFKKTRLNEIKRILKQHPSLCDIFQASTRKVLKKLKLNLCCNTMEQLANCAPGVIERVLLMVRDKIRRDEELNKSTKDAEQNMSSGGSYYEACGDEEHVLVVPVKTRVNGVLETVQQKVVSYDSYLTLKEELKDAKDSSEVLKQKVEHLDSLLKLKDERIDELQKQLERKQARRKEVEAFQNSLAVPFETVQSPIITEIAPNLSRKSSLKTIESNHRVQTIESNPKIAKPEESKIPIPKIEPAVVKSISKPSITEVSSADLINNQINVERIKSDVFKEVEIVDAEENHAPKNVVEGDGDSLITDPQNEEAFKEPNERNLGDTQDVEEFKDSEQDAIVTIEETIQKEITDIVKPSDANYIM